MSRLPICISVLYVLTLQLAAATELFAADRPRRPNVVLIMTDNHGAWTLGCYGNPEIRTPQIDRLAAEGTLFTRAFASNPVCSPTRATFLTGLIPSQHGVHSFLSGGGLQVGPDARCTLDQLTSLPEVLHDAGYSCGLVGKWHLGDNVHPQEGFDEYWITMPHGGTSTFYDASVIENGKIRNEPKYLTDLWTDHAIKFIDQQAASEQPFFLFLAYNGPYALGRLLLNEGRNRHAAYYSDQDLTSFPREQPHPWQLNNRDYINNPISIRRVATEVSGIDDGVGAVMNRLKENGIDDETVVIFVADQGWVGGHGGFFGMGDHTRPLTARDGMMRIPTIWRHPQSISPGVRSDRMIANYDLMPTLLSYLGLGDKMPKTPQSPGVDYCESLFAKADSPGSVSKPRPVYYEFENLRCIRTERYKYVHRHPNGPHELYDLQLDPDEFNNLVNDADSLALRETLNQQLKSFFSRYTEPQYDMWNGGSSQVRIHDGIDEEIAQLVPVEPPPLPDGFSQPEAMVPNGFSVELAAGPPLVTHPTMGCFDDRGRLYVCNNAGVNLSSEELEAQLPNAIRQLTDTDQDGRFDRSTVFADKMTFPMGGVWHDGALYVASPPNIWRLRDTDDDGIADQRDVIVDKFGYTGNAASIHGCFCGPDGRLYWVDGYHGHEFTDAAGNVTSKREGSYLFSSRMDGSDVQIHCGGGMDNPVEVDFTDQGDMLGTVNILYTRPRVDCLVHWLHGGAYPHRERVLSEIKITGDLLGPAHRFGHVAIAGMTRYRSGVMNHQWKDNLFATCFNGGKVVRLQMRPDGSTYGATQYEFLSSTSRDFHPTDVIEDADGSLLVIDTGGWFYRGCPTSQFAKPELLGGIYRVRRDGMTPLVDPRGLRIDWKAESNASVVKLLNDTRFAVRERAIDECVKRGEPIISALKTVVSRGDVRVRRNCVWALTRLAQERDTASEATAALAIALDDAVAGIRQAACHGLSRSVATIDSSLIFPLLNDDNPAVRRVAATTLGQLGDAQSIKYLLRRLPEVADRSEEHAIIYALIEIGDAQAILTALHTNDVKNSRALTGAITAIDQIDTDALDAGFVLAMLAVDDPQLRSTALRIAVQHDDWSDAIALLVANWAVDNGQLARRPDTSRALISKYAGHASLAARLGEALITRTSNDDRDIILQALANANSPQVHPSWIEPIARQLDSHDAKVVHQALQIVSSTKAREFDDRLKMIANDPTRETMLRVSALQVLQGKSGKLSDEAFFLLLGLLREGLSPTQTIVAAQTLGSSNLTSRQLKQLTRLLDKASPMQLRELLRAFGRTREPQIINDFLNSVAPADAFLTLTENELSEVVKGFPQESLQKANQLLDRLKQHELQKHSRLAALHDKVDRGDPERGREVFHGKQAKCSGCHRVGDQGHRVGPDLTTIGANRSAPDLLESIVLPSASIVRDYESYNVLTTDGRAISGIVAAESTGQLVIQQSTGEKVTILRDEIERLVPSPVSIMPNGLEEALTETDLADVIAYLRSLR